MKIVITRRMARARRKLAWTALWILAGWYFLLRRSLKEEHAGIDVLPHRQAGPTFAYVTRL